MRGVVFTNDKHSEVPHAVFPPASKICIIVKDFDAEDKVTKQTYSELKMALNKVLIHTRNENRNEEKKGKLTHTNYQHRSCLTQS